MKHNGRIAYHTIVAAKQSDPDAIQEILRHYGRYMMHFCRRTVYDDANVPHFVIDEEYRSRMESAYLEAVLLHYDIDRLPPGETLEQE